MLLNLIVPGCPGDLFGNIVDDREKDKAGKRRQRLMVKSRSREMRNCGRK